MHFSVLPITLNFLHCVIGQEKENEEEVGRGDEEDARNLEDDSINLMLEDEDKMLEDEMNFNDSERLDQVNKSIVIFIKKNLTRV